MTRSPFGPGVPMKMLGWDFDWPEWIAYARHWEGCAFCGAPQECIAAMIPWRKGGARTIGNAVPACLRCRREKSTRLYTVWCKAMRAELRAQALSPAEYAREYDHTATYQKHLARTLARYAELRARAQASRATSYRSRERYPEDDGGHWTP